MSWQPGLPELSPPSPFLAEGPVDIGALNDPFVRRFYETPRWISLIRRGANIPPLRGSYDDWRTYIEDAVRENAAPSRELIAANEMLAAWEAQLGVTKVSSFPITVGFSLTDICNARCVFCAYVPERVVEERVSLERLERADWLRFCKNYTPNGGGLGEPFAHPQILEILRLFRRNAPYLNFGSITNASLLRDKVIDEITGYVTYLYVSLNSARKETYEATMRPLKWDKLVDNLTKLKEAKARRGTVLPRLRCGFVVHKHNLDELPELPALLARLGFTDVNINFMTPPPHSESRALYTVADTVYQEPHRADHAFRQVESECARHSIALVKPLPSMSLLLHGMQVPVPDKADLPKSVNRTTGFYGVATGRSPSAGACSSHGPEDEPAIAAEQPHAEAPPIEAATPSYGFAAYHALQKQRPAGAAPPAPPPADETGVLKRLGKGGGPAALAPLAAVGPPVGAIRKSPRKGSPLTPRSSGTTLRLPRPIIIDDTVSDDLAEVVDQFEKGVSYEWVRYAARGQKAFCWAPWRMLKVDIFERTLICCNFFGKLPEFEWPTAASFHAESGMWNHPFMVHLRRTMGTKDELPYCTFCKTSDKRHLGNSDEKMAAKTASLKIYQDVLDATRKVAFRGGIDKVEDDLSGLRVSIGSRRTRDVPAFSRDKQFYRQLARQKGFVGLGRVLQLGSRTRAMAAFLAEAGNELSFVDTTERAFDRLRHVSSQLGLPDVAMQAVADPRRLPYGDASFDGIWVDGIWLREFGRRDMLVELRRLLARGGRIHFSQVSSVGELVLDVVERKADASDLVTIIEKGPAFDGKGSFLTTADIISTLTAFGLTTDKRLPAQPARIGDGHAKLAPIGRHHAVIARRLANPTYLDRLRDDRSQLNGLERSVTFTAVGLRERHPVH